MKIEKVFIINLERRSDRLEKVDFECQKMGLPYEVFPAIDYRDLDMNWSFLDQPLFRLQRFTPGAYALRETTIKLFEKAIREGYENFLILEDDVYFTSTAKVRLKWMLDELPDDWDVFQLGCYHSKKPSELSQNLLKVNASWALHASLFNKKSYKKILNIIRNNFIPVDSAIGRITAQYLNIYSATPNIAIPHVEESDISNEMKGVSIPEDPFECEEVLTTVEAINLNPYVDLLDIEKGIIQREKKLKRRTLKKH